MLYVLAFLGGIIFSIITICVFDCCYISRLFIEFFDFLFVSIMRLIKWIFFRTYYLCERDTGNKFILLIPRLTQWKYTTDKTRQYYVEKTPKNINYRKIGVQNGRWIPKNIEKLVRK